MNQELFKLILCSFLLVIVAWLAWNEFDDEMRQLLYYVAFVLALIFVALGADAAGAFPSYHTVTVKDGKQ